MFGFMRRQAAFIGIDGHTCKLWLGLIVQISIKNINKYYGGS